jgi:serine/threonine protein phosphatase PrpC
VCQIFPGIGPLRVWHKSEGFPGLAMTRSIGDHVARDLGIIPDPDIFMHRVTSDMPVLVIASDGVFEVLSNKDISDIVWAQKNKSSNLIAQLIIKEAYSRWKLKDGNIDDCT